MAQWPVQACLCEELFDGSKNWPMKVQHELKLNHTIITMIRLMCGVNKLNERKVKNSKNS